jgi:hypothetical protein
MGFKRATDGAIAGIDGLAQTQNGFLLLRATDLKAARRPAPSPGESLTAPMIRQANAYDLFFFDKTEA